MSTTATLSTEVNNTAPKMRLPTYVANKPQYNPLCRVNQRDYDNNGSTNQHINTHCYYNNLYDQ